MGRRIIWTERASSDIEAIVRYIRPRDRVAAFQIGSGIYHRAEVLLKHPEAGSLLEELKEGGWRKLVYRRWKLVYTVREETVIIARVWPAAMGNADFDTPL